MSNVTLLAIRVSWHAVGRSGSIHASGRISIGSGCGVLCQWCLQQNYHESRGVSRAAPMLPGSEYSCSRVLLTASCPRQPQLLLARGGSMSSLGCNRQTESVCRDECKHNLYDDANTQLWQLSRSMRQLVERTNCHSHCCVPCPCHFSASHVHICGSLTWFPALRSRRSPNQCVPLAAWLSGSHLSDCAFSTFYLCVSMPTCLTDCEVEHA